MQAYICTVCDYLYDEESSNKNKNGIGITFEDLDENWFCPNCGVRANEFKPVDSDRTPDIPSL